MCMNVMAECHCGFTGTDPNLVRPNWRIIFRSDDGSIVSNDTVDGDDIAQGHINGLQWVPDLTSGGNNAKLLVGPVNMTHNQSSYQCIFTIGLGDTIISSVGTMTVVPVGKTKIINMVIFNGFYVTDPLSVTINVDEICTTSITISLNTHNHSSCGEVSHDVTISGNVISPNTTDGSKYTIDGLESNTLYNITVTSTHNGSIRILNKDVGTILPVCKFVSYVCAYFN